MSEAGQKAPNLGAQRNVIRQMFESVQLVRSATFPRGPAPKGINEQWAEPKWLEADGERYWLLLSLRPSAVDMATFKPIGQAIPVPEWQSYPQGFLCRYCWW